MKEHIQQTRKQIHEVLYRLSRVVDNGTSIPLVENNSTQVFTVFQGIPTCCRVDLTDQQPPVVIKFKSLQTEGRNKLPNSRKSDLQVKGSFKDDFKVCDLTSKGFTQIKVTAFKGPNLYIMMTS